MDFEEHIFQDGVTQMAVPDFQSLMLPLLKLAGDAQEHSIGQVIEKLASSVGLSDSEKKELLPSGAMPRFDNRVRWARVYLKKAGLLENIGRGKFRITDRGLQILKENPPRVDTKFLKRFPEFLDFQNLSKQNSRTDNDEKQDEPDQTPEENLEASYQSLRRALAQELLERIKNSSSSFFENLVVALLVAMGYGGSRRDAGLAVGRSGDGGIDGIIKRG